MRTEPSPRDWIEDASHENGNYLCRCVICKETFTGHKRRVICRACHVARADEVIRRENILMEANLLPDQWVLMTVEELVKERAQYADLLLRYHVEQRVRHQLVAAIEGIRSNTPYHWARANDACCASTQLDADEHARGATP